MCKGLNVVQMCAGAYMLDMTSSELQQCLNFAKRYPRSATPERVEVITSILQARALRETIGEYNLELSDSTRQFIEALESKVLNILFGVL